MTTKRVRVKPDPWPASEPLPSLVDPWLMQRIFGISETTFLRWQRIGRFAEFECSTEPGVRRYSGIKLERYRAGQPLTHVFGRKKTA